MEVCHGLSLFEELGVEDPGLTLATETSAWATSSSAKAAKDKEEKEENKLEMEIRFQVAAVTKPLISVQKIVTLACQLDRVILIV